MGVQELERNGGMDGGKNKRAIDIALASRLVTIQN